MATPIRIDGTLGDCSVTDRAEVSEPALHNLTAAERRAWIDVNDWIRRHPGCSIEKAVAATGLSLCVFNEAKKKAQASNGEALSHKSFSSRDMIRPGDSILKKAGYVSPTEKKRRGPKPRPRPVEGSSEEKPKRRGRPPKVRPEMKLDQQPDQPNDPDVLALNTIALALLTHSPKDRKRLLILALRRVGDL